MEIELHLVPGTFQPEHVCYICSKVFLFNARLARHMKSCDSKQSQAKFTQVLSQQSTGKSCQFLVWFYGISTFVGYLMPNSFLCK